MRQGGLGDWDSERNIELQYSVHEIQHRLLWVPLAGAWSHCIDNTSRRGISASRDRARTLSWGTILLLAVCSDFNL